MTDEEIYKLYKNEILSYVANYKEYGIFSVCEDENFYNYLGIEKQDINLYKYIEGNRAYLFNTVVRSYGFRKIQVSIKEALNKLYNRKENNIVTIIKLLNDLKHEYKMLVLDIDMYVASKNDWIQDKNGLAQNFNDCLFLIDFLHEFMQDGVFEKMRDILFIFIYIIMHEIRTRFACTFLIGVLLLIAESNYFPTHIKNISREFYCYLNEKMKNSRLLGLKINYDFPKKDKIYERTSRDRTSQMILVFSYNNYDSYCFRFDMAHKGVEFSHINFLSPGEKNEKVKSAIIDRKEYEKILEKYPYLEKAFISYEDNIALKSRINIEPNLSGDEKENYNAIENNYEHIKFPKKKYSESEMKDFYSLLKLYLNGNVVSNIKKGDGDIVYCFQENKLYNCIFYFCLALLESCRQELINKSKQKEKTTKEETITGKIFDIIIDYLKQKKLLDNKMGKKDEMFNLEMVLEEIEEKIEEFCPLKRLYNTSASIILDFLSSISL